MSSEEQVQANAMRTVGICLALGDSTASVVELISSTTTLPDRVRMLMRADAFLGIVQSHADSDELQSAQTLIHSVYTKWQDELEGAQ